MTLDIATTGPTAGNAVGSARREGRLAKSLRSGLTTTLIVVVMLAALLLLTFAIGRLLPADPVLAIVGDRASQQEYDRVFRALHLDRPLLEQFLIYSQDMLTGNFGQSTVTRQPIAADLARYLPATVELALAAILIGAGLGVPLGVISAHRANEWPDQLGRLISVIGISVPVFWTGLVALLVFYGWLGWTGGPGRIDITYQYTLTEVTGSVLVDAVLARDWAALGNAFSHLILPASVLGIGALGYIARMTRTLVLGELRQDYITVARLKGLSERRVLWRHALPNVAGPILAIVALVLGYLLEGAVLTETVFAWPGLGLYLTQSLFASDVPTVLAGTLVIGIIFMGLNILAEVLQNSLDPRSAAS